MSQDTPDAPGSDEPPPTRVDRILAKAAPEDARELLNGDARNLGRLRVVARVALRYVWLYAALLAASLVLTVGAFMDVYHRTEMPQFCSVCHEMSANFASWSSSRHTSIRCVDCHARPGFGGWVAAKLGGVRQLVTHFSAASIDDIHVEQHHRDIASENCQRCHAGAARLEERRGLVIGHEHHLRMGVQCVRCHSGRFVHPKEEVVDSRVLLADPKDCHDCHNGETRVGEVVAFNARDETNCQRCHPDSRAGLRHGADDPSQAQRKPCLDCHTSTGEGDHFAYTDEDVGKICDRCHEVQRTYASAHPPFARGRCSDCHRAMSPAHLYPGGGEPTATGCLNCHEKLAQVLASGDAKRSSRFTDGSDDLHRTHSEALDGDERWCLRCHDAHGSDARLAMLRLAPDPDDEESGPGTVTVEESGGSCTGSCHGEDEMQWEHPSGGGG